MSWLDDVGAWLDSQITGLTYDPDSREANLIVEPKEDPYVDKAVILRRTGGPPPDRAYGFGFPTFQAEARAILAEADWALDRLTDIYSTLHGHHDFRAGEPGTFVVEAFALASDPTPLGPDDQGRPRFVLNFQLEIEQPTLRRASL